jgi:hypothetical protein
MQRKQERNIRALKRQTVVAQDIMDCAADAELKEAAKADYQAVAFKLKTAEQELKAFCKATNQDRDRFREQSIGFGRSQAQKAVWAKKKSKNSLTSAPGSGTIKSNNTQQNQRRQLELFNDYGVPENARITSKQIEEDLGTSSTGKDILQYIKNTEIRPKLTYDQRQDDVRGEEIGGQITIYLANCKDVKTATCTLIHECTHYRYGIGQSQWAECVCVAQEIKHRRSRDYLLNEELRMIIKAVKAVYPEYNWRNGGIIYGKRSKNGR